MYGQLLSLIMVQQDTSTDNHTHTKHAQHTHTCIKSVHYKRSVTTRLLLVNNVSSVFFINISSDFIVVVIDIVVEAE